MIPFPHKTVLVTGAAGFIGQNLIRQLLAEGCKVIALDNFLTGKKRWFPNCPDLHVIQASLGFESPWDLAVQLVQEATFVFHIQGLADVRGGPNQMELDHRQNFQNTRVVLQMMEHMPRVRGIAFTSSACVYGDADIIPTPETYGGRQTSIYGAHKLASEAVIQATCHYRGWEPYIFRLVSWLGDYYHHGCVVDFRNALKRDPSVLPVLGSGCAVKSFLHAQDGIMGMLLPIRLKRQGVYNLGHEESVTVMQVARYVAEALDLTPRIVPQDGMDRGWIGDQLTVKLDIRKIRELDWEPTIPIHTAVKNTVRFLEYDENGKS